MDLPPLTTDEKRNLAIRIIAESTTSLVSSLVDITGPETAIEVMRPYFEHAGRATAALLSRSLPPDAGDDLTRIQLILLQSNHCFSDRGTRNAWVSDDMAGCEVADCTYSGGCPELCTMICDGGSNGICRFINPVYEMKMLVMQTRGSPGCSWVVRRTGSTGTAPGPSSRRRLEPFLSEEEMQAVQLQYLGEFWVLVTRGFLDVVEERAAFRVIEPCRRLMGLRLGLSLKPPVSPGDGGLESAARLVRLVGECLGQEGTPLLETGAGIEWRISSCPFADAPNGLCRQLAGMNRGICMSVNPRFEFTMKRDEEGGGGCLYRVQETPPSRLDRLWEI